MRVFLIIRTPETLKSHAGTVSEALVEWFDIGPTLTELVGGSLEFPQFAKSLVPNLKDPGIRHRDTAISEHKGEIMILTHDWKMVLNEEGEPYLLFDVRKDPGETRNQVGNPETKEVRQELKLQILDHLVKSQIQFGRESPPYSVVAG